MASAFGRIPVWLWLTVIVAGSAALRALLARDFVAPFIFVDELIWAELGRGIGDTGERLVRDEPDRGFGAVYPLVVSPVYAAFDNLVHAYTAVKTLNAVLMSLAAVPAYFLARRVVQPGLALLAALMAVAIPSLVYTATVMTENVYYPLFLVVALQLVLVLERPSPLRVGLLVVLLGLAFGTRAQTAALAPGVVLAPLLLAAFDGTGLRAALARYRVLFGTFAALGLLALAYIVATGKPPKELLGPYAPVGESRYELGEVLRYILWHVAELSLYLLVIPLAATVVLVARARSLDRPLQVFLAATLSLTAGLVPVVAAFASAFSFRIEERYLFYVAPLFVIALLAWIERGAPRPRVVTAVAAASSALVVLGIPFERVVAVSATSDTLMLLPVWSLQDRIGESWVTPVVLAGCLGLAAAFVFVPKRYAIALPLVVLWVWIAALQPIWSGTHGLVPYTRNLLHEGIRASDRDWIDRALEDGDRAAYIWTGRSNPAAIWHPEFFNRAVGPVYHTALPTPGLLPETPVRIDPRSGELRRDDGARLSERFVLSDPSLVLDGEVVASDAELGTTLWRVVRPAAVASSTEGLYPNDTWSGPEVTWRRWRCRGGELFVSLTSDSTLFPTAQTVTATHAGRVVRARMKPDRSTTLRVPLREGLDRCVVTFRVSPTAVPAEVTPANADTRELGAHFNRFVYRPGT